MPLTRFKLSSIADDGITSAKLAHNIHFDGTEAIKLPVGTTAQRANAVAGDQRFNTSLNLMEYYDGTIWKSIDAPPVITSVTYPNSSTELDPGGGQTLSVAGQGFATTGAVSATINDQSVGAVTVNSSSSITITNTPALSAGNYQLKITNPSGLTGTFEVSYDNTPTWNTALNTVIADQAQGSTINITGVTASEGADSITYSEVTTVLTGSGSGEMGLSLNSSTGAITGTAPSVSGDTTYTFTLRAEDAEGQRTDRQFRITITTNYFGDGSDGAFSS